VSGLGIPTRLAGTGSRLGRVGGAVSRLRDVTGSVRHLDVVVVAITFALTGIGLVAIYSAKYQALTAQGITPTYFVTRQVVAAGLGVVAMLAAATFDYRRLRPYAPLVYLFALLLLVAVLTPLGTEIRGSQRWIPVLGYRLQPSEVMKVALLLLLAMVFHEGQGHPTGGRTVLALALTLVPVGLVFVQPDLGTSIVYVWVTGAVFLVAGVRVRYLVGLAVTAAAAFAVGLRTELIREYQVRRLTAFLASNDAGAEYSGALFQTRQSLIAIGSGRLSGKGLFGGTQTALAYVPDNHTDFVFTVIGEEFGFVGTTFVLALFGLLVWRAIRIASLAEDRDGTLIAAGIAAMIVLQVFVNVGMTIGIMPVTGLPLPFVSYGGTSLLVWFGLMGLLLNVQLRR
jgi:rod shape determining protein RodA